MIFRSAMTLGLRAINNKLEETLNHEIRKGPPVVGLDQGPLPQLRHLEKYLPDNKEATRLRELFRRGLNTPLSGNGLTNFAARSLQSRARDYIQAFPLSVNTGYQNHAYEYDQPTQMQTGANVAHFSQNSVPANMPQPYQMHVQTNVLRPEQMQSPMNAHHPSPMRFTLDVPDAPQKQTAPYVPPSPERLTTTNVAMLSGTTSGVTTAGDSSTTYQPRVHHAAGTHQTPTVSVTWQPRPAHILQTVLPKIAEHPGSTDAAHKAGDSKSPVQELRTVRNTCLALMEARRSNDAHAVVTKAIMAKGLSGYSDDQASQVLDELSKTSNAMGKAWLRDVSATVRDALSGTMRPEDARLVLTVQLKPDSAPQDDKELGNFLIAHLLDKRLPAPKTDRQNAAPPMSVAAASPTRQVAAPAVLSAAPAIGRDFLSVRDHAKTLMDQKDHRGAHAYLSGVVLKGDTSGFEKDQLGKIVFRLSITAGELGKPALSSICDDMRDALLYDDNPAHLREMVEDKLLADPTMASEDRALAKYLLSQVGDFIEYRPLPDPMPAAPDRHGTPAHSPATTIPNQTSVAGLASPESGSAIPGPGLRSSRATLRPETQSPVTPVVSRSTSALATAPESTPETPPQAVQFDLLELKSEAGKLLDSRQGVKAYSSLTDAMLGGCLNGASLSEASSYLSLLQTSAERTGRHEVARTADLFTEAFLDDKDVEDVRLDFGMTMRAGPRELGIPADQFAVIENINALFHQHFPVKA